MALRRVRARELGFFGVLRQPGDEFLVEDGVQLSGWLELVEEPKGKAKGKKPDEGEDDGG